MTTDTNKFRNIELQLKELLESLTDNNNEPYFESVIRGIPNNNYRGFTFPIAIVRTRGVEYKTATFNKRNTPEYINSSIGILVAGDQQESYDYLLDIMDKIQEHFETNPNWINVNGTNRITTIESSAINNISSEETLIRIGVFDLKHHVYE